MPRTLAIQIQQPSGAVRIMFLKLNSDSCISTFVGTATPSSPPWTLQADLVVKDGIDAVHKSDLNDRERPMHPVPASFLLLVRGESHATPNKRLALNLEGRSPKTKLNLNALNSICPTLVHPKPKRLLAAFVPGTYNSTPTISKPFNSQTRNLQAPEVGPLIQGKWPAEPLPGIGISQESEP